MLSQNAKKCDNKAIVFPSTAKIKFLLRKRGKHERDNDIEYEMQMSSTFTTLMGI